MQKTGRAAGTWANVAPLRWLLCPGTGPTLRERLLRAEMPGRGLPGPASRASPPPCAPFLHATGNRLSSLSRCFPGKRSLPLCSPPPGCRKEVTGTFPLLLFARPSSDEEPSNSEVWVNSPIHFQQTKPELFQNLLETSPSRLCTLPLSPPRPEPNSKLSKA